MFYSTSYQTTHIKYSAIQILDYLETYFAVNGNTTPPDIINSETGELVDLTNIMYKGNYHTLEQMLDILPYITEEQDIQFNC